MTRTLAKAGFTLVETVVAIAILGILAGLLVGAVQKVRTSAARLQCLNNLKQVALSQHAYHQAHGHYPSWVSYQDGKDPFPFMAWGGRLLPFLGEQPLWDRTVAAFSANPDFQANPPHVGYSTTLTIYLCPADGRNLSDRTGQGPAFSSYLGVSGAASRQGWDGMYFLDSRVRSTDITDGSSNTLMIGERPPSTDLIFGWWYGGWGQRKDGSGDSVLSVRETNYYPGAPSCPRGPYRFGPGRLDEQCDLFHFWSSHPGGANFAFADGSVRFLRYDADAILPALATRAGGEAVPIPD